MVTYSNTLNFNPSQHVNESHHGPASETPFKWRFAGGPIVVRDCMLAGNGIIALTYVSMSVCVQVSFPNGAMGWSVIYNYGTYLTQFIFKSHKIISAPCF